MSACFRDKYLDDHILMDGWDGEYKCKAILRIKIHVYHERLKATIKIVGDKGHIFWCDFESKDIRYKPGKYLEEVKCTKTPRELRWWNYVYTNKDGEIIDYKFLPTLRQYLHYIDPNPLTDIYIEDPRLEQIYINFYKVIRGIENANHENKGSCDDDIELLEGFINKYK